VEGLAAIVLAAGLSRRFERGFKLGYPVGGHPLLEHALRAVEAAAPAVLVVVTGPDDLLSQALARDHGAHVAVNPEPARGLGRTIACGVEALPDGLRGAFVALGDMPCIAPSTYLALATAFADAQEIVVPVHDARWGHPVLFGAAHFAALLALDGDRGARPVVVAARDTLRTVDVDDPGVLLDVDTLADAAFAERVLARRHTSAGA
jgi:CTP:molybdopterin cytidylyltransferase MocA